MLIPPYGIILTFVQMPHLHCISQDYPYFLIYHTFTPIIFKFRSAFELHVAYLRCAQPRS